MKKILIIIGTLFAIASIAFVLSSTSELKGQFSVGTGPKIGQATQVKTQTTESILPESSLTQNEHLEEKTNSIKAQNTEITLTPSTDTKEQKELAPSILQNTPTVSTQVVNSTPETDSSGLLENAPIQNQNKDKEEITEVPFRKNSIHLVVTDESGERIMDLSKYDFNFDDNEIIEFSKAESFYEFKLRNGSETHIMITAEGYENLRTKKIDPTNSIDPVTIQLKEKIEIIEEVIEEETHEEDPEEEPSESNSSNPQEESRSEDSNSEEAVSSYAPQYTNQESSNDSTETDADPQTEGCTHNFTDVLNHKNEDAICQLVEMGIIKDSNPIYNPDRAISVAEYIQVLLKLAGHTESNVNSQLLANPAHWANGWVAKAEELDVMRVRDGFSNNLDLPITKADAALYAVRLANVRFYPEASPFKDVSKTDYFGYAVIYLHEEGMIRVQSNYFNPFNYLSRGAAMELLLNSTPNLFQ